jgi:hypothetical protein
MSCTVNISSPTLVLEGIASGQLAAIAAGCPAGNFAWTSDKPAVATVTAGSPAGPDPQDHIGTIRPAGAGSATITVTFSGASASSVVVVTPRNFIIVFGDPGKGVHNLGRLSELAALTHEREVRANKAPGVPAFGPADTITTAHISRASDLLTRLSVGNVAYLAYFGHSWNEGSGPGALFIGQDHAADTNLTEGLDPPGPVQTCTSPATLPKTAFRPNSSVRLFSCRGSFGGNSIAEQIARQLGVPVFGFDNSGGSIFTNDPKLGHGERSATAADLKAAVVATKDVWMVPSDGTPHFKQF